MIQTVNYKMDESKNKNKTNNLVKVKKTGGSRKRSNPKRAKKQAKEEKFKREFTAILEKINNCIKEANIENTTDELVNYLNQSLVLIYSELRPQELHRKSKEIKNIKYLRKNWINIRTLIVKNIEEEQSNTYIFRKSFSFYKKNFSEYGLQYIALCYKRLYDSLLSKVYALNPTDDQRPDMDELKLSMKRLGLENIGIIELESVLTKDELHRQYLEKTLEYHMDTPQAIKEQEKYKILRKRIRKALVSLELYLDYFIEKDE